jgi:hypothetical protein
VSDLAEFLLQRIAEDEGWAREALDLSDFGETREWRWVRIYGRGSSSFYEGCPDPARVLADCAAKRAIVELHPLYRCTHARCGGDGSHCRTCGADVPAPCPTLLALAQPYADHPDYRNEWRP